MVAKKKHTRMRVAKPQAAEEPMKFVVLPASVAKFKQIEGAGGSLYGLDEEGRVFAYIGYAWVRIDGDDDRVLPVRAENIEELGERLANTLPDEKRLGKQIEKERTERIEKYERGREAEEFLAPRLRYLDNGLARLEKQVAALVKALEKEPTES
jgi:hypothetical protein